MAPRPPVVTLACILAFGACTGGGERGERRVALSEVPPPVLRAAAAAVPGVRIDGAGIEHEGGRAIYELDGEVDGRTVEIELTPDGRVLEIEPGD